MPEKAAPGVEGPLVPVIEQPPEGTVRIEEDPSTGLPAGFKGKKAIPKEDVVRRAEAVKPADKVAAVAAEQAEISSDPEIPDGCPPEIAALYPYLTPGLTLQAIWNWKKAYGHIYFVDICDILYFYRPLAKPEYKAIMNLEGATRDIQEEKIAELATLFPKQSIETLRVGMAGLAGTLTEYIMRASAFGAVMTPTKL